MAFFLKKSFLCISRRRWSVIHKAILLPTCLDLSGAYLSIDCISTSFHMDHISFGWLSVSIHITPFGVGPLGSQTCGNFSSDGFFLILAPERSNFALCVI